MINPGRRTVPLAFRAEDITLLTYPHGIADITSSHYKQLHSRSVAKATRIQELKAPHDDHALTHPRSPVRYRSDTTRDFSTSLRPRAL